MKKEVWRIPDIAQLQQAPVREKPMVTDKREKRVSPQRLRKIDVKGESHRKGGG
jgi:hypothetical protein